MSELRWSVNIKKNFCVLCQFKLHLVIPIKKNMAVTLNHVLIANNVIHELYYQKRSDII